MWTLISESKCFEESRSFKVIDVVWRPYFFFLYDTVLATLVLLGSPELPENDRCGSYGRPGRAAASRSTVEHRYYKLVSPFLQDGDLRQPGYAEAQMICNKTWCSPFGAENPICWRTEMEHQTFLCCNVRLFWGFFCTCMHIFLIWIQVWCHLSSLPQCICGFSHTLITSRTKTPESGYKWLIHLGEVDLSSGSKQVSASRCFPCCFFSFLGACFSSPRFWGGTPYTLLSWFCGILVFLLQLWWVWPEAQDLDGTVSPLEFSLSCLGQFLWVSKLFVFSPNISITHECHVSVLREKVFFCTEVLPFPHVYTEVRPSKFCHVFAR